MEPNDLLCSRNARPQKALARANGTSRRAISPGRVVRFSIPLSEGVAQGCPLLRASNEHIPIVRVLRARRASAPSFPFPSYLAHSLIKRVAWVGSPTAHVERPQFHRGHSVSTTINDPTKPARYLVEVVRPGLSSIARVQRAPSERARCASRRMTRPYYRNPSPPVPPPNPPQFPPNPPCPVPQYSPF